MNNFPTVLCIGGLDPTGGAGIQADIETVTALGGRALALATALTEQDTHNIHAVLPTPLAFFSVQFDRLLDDIRPDAIKIGLLGSVEMIELLATKLQERGIDGPLVVDPVLAAGGGFEFAPDTSRDIAERITRQLAPISTLLTPNRREVRQLTGIEDPLLAAQTLLRGGAGAILLTGADEATGDQVVNHLVRGDGTVESLSWPRLPHSYHGSGCTLAAACATAMALGANISNACAQAQAFSWRALKRASRHGGGQWLPRRVA